MSHYISNTSLSKYCHLPPIPVIISVEGDYGAPNLLRDRGPLCGGLRLHYYGRGSHLPGETPPAGPISCLKCGPSGGVPGNPFAGPAWGGPGRLEIPPPSSDDTRTYQISFPQASHDITCPVVGCSGKASIRGALQVPFLNRRVWYTIVVLEGGNHPLPL